MIKTMRSSGRVIPLLFLVLLCTVPVPSTLAADGGGLGMRAKTTDHRVEGLLNRAKTLEVRGEWATALDMYSRAVAGARVVLQNRIQQLGENHLDVAASLDRIAELYLARQDLLEKMDRDTDRKTNELCDFVLVYERAEWIRTKAYASPFHPEIARTLDMAARLWRRCHPSMADKFYKAAIRCREKLFGPKHPEVADACDRYAYYLQWSMMKFKDARTLYERALKIRENAFGKTRLQTLKNLPDLAWTAYYSGDKAYAKSVIQRTVSTIQGGMNPDHSGIATTLRTMGLLLDEMDDPGGASILLQRAADIMKKVYGYRHPEVAETLTDLGLVYRNRNEPDRALRYYEEALGILESVYGPEHPALEEVMIGLVAVLEEMGEKERAQELNKRHKKILIGKEM